MAVAWLNRLELMLQEPNLQHLSLRTAKIRGVVVHWIGDVPEGKAPAAVWRVLQTEAMSGANVNHTQYGDIEYNAGACESIAHPGNGTSCCA